MQLYVDPFHAVFAFFSTSIFNTKQSLYKSLNKLEIHFFQVYQNFSQRKLIFVESSVVLDLLRTIFVEHFVKNGSTKSILTALFFSTVGSVV